MDQCSKLVLRDAQPARGFLAVEKIAGH